MSDTKDTVQQTKKPKLTLHQAANVGYTIGCMESLLARLASQKAPFALVVTPKDLEALNHALKYTRNQLQQGKYGTEFLMQANLWDSVEEQP